MVAGGHLPLLCQSSGLGFHPRVRYGLTGTGFLSFSFFFSSPLPLIWLFPLKLRQLLLDSQSQLDEAKSEAQKQSAELALVGWLTSWAGEYGIGVCVYVCDMTLVCMYVLYICVCV